MINNDVLLIQVYSKSFKPLTKIRRLLKKFILKFMFYFVEKHNFVGKFILNFKSWKTQGFQFVRFNLIYL